MVTIGCYRIISPSFKNYFGKSINIERRLSEYSKANCKSQPKLYRSIKKYGWDAHTVVIYKCEEKDLDMYEKYFIVWYNCIGKNGLNCMAGGNGCRRTTEDQRKRMGDSKKGLLIGEKNPMFGKKQSQKTKNAIKKYIHENMGKITELSRISSTGRVYNQESRKKKSEKLLGHIVSDDLRSKLRASMSKIVLQFDANWQFIKEWPSVKEAQKTLKIYNISTTISKIDGEKQVGGFKWKYKQSESTTKKRTVSKYSMDDEFICSYLSIIDAAKDNKVNPSDISQVCQGNGISVSGFKYKYLINKK